MSLPCKASAKHLSDIIARYIPLDNRQELYELLSTSSLNLEEPIFTYIKDCSPEQYSVLANLIIKLIYEHILNKTEP